MGPVLPGQTNQTINELTTLLVTNTATDASASNEIASTIVFTYTNRTALLADGWSFLATVPLTGATRNTENTNSSLGPVVSYDQTGHPGVLRIPCGGGDMWQELNNTTNSLFRALAADWVSVRLAVAFAPGGNYQQAYVAYYQDDDNYIEAGLDFGGSQQALMIQETGGTPNVIGSAGVNVTGLSLRLDRDPSSAAITGYYSLDGTTWATLGTVGQSMTNARLAIWTGGSTSGTTPLDLQRLDIVQSNSVAPVLSYQLVNAPPGASIDATGLITLDAERVGGGRART